MKQLYIKDRSHCWDIPGAMLCKAMYYANKREIRKKKLILLLDYLSFAALCGLVLWLCWYGQLF